MKRLWQRCKEKGFAIMIIGFLTAVIGLLFYMGNRYGMVGRAMIVVTIAGIVIYVFGRVCVIVHKQDLQKQRHTRGE